MAQVTNGACLERNEDHLCGRRPLMQERDTGVYTDLSRPNPGCVWWNADWAYRADVPKPNWAGKGMARDTHVAGSDVIHGDLATPAEDGHRVFVTEQGPVALANQPPKFTGWTPSIECLNGLPYVDSRLTAISDRYYK